MESRGKGSHRVVNLNGSNLSLPIGILEIGLPTRLIQRVGVDPKKFSANFKRGSIMMTPVSKPIYTVEVLKAEELGGLDRGSLDA